MNKKIIILIFVFAGLASCKKHNHCTRSSNDVWIYKSAFDPSPMVITKGTAVKFINKDNITHNVSETGNLISADVDLQNNNQFSVTFNNTGTYNVFCKYHSNEKATIIVQ